MKKKSKSIPAGFNIWQGYVSSISSLLIALLMLIGILGMATSVIQEAMDKGLISEDSDSYECKELLNCKKEFIPQKEFFQIDLASRNKLLDILESNEKDKYTKGHRFHIQFPAGAENNPQWVSEIQKSLKAYTGLKNAIWQIYTLAEQTDSQQLRRGYMRNLTVRQALLNSGVKAEAVETLMDTEQTSSDFKEKDSVVLTVVFN